MSQILLVTSRIPKINDWVDQSLALRYAARQPAAVRNFFVVHCGHDFAGFALPLCGIATTNALKMTAVAQPGAAVPHDPTEYWQLARRGRLCHTVHQNIGNCTPGAAVPYG